MSCVEFHESLYEYAQDELGAEIRIVCEQHLVECRHCVVVVESYRATITFAKSLKSPSPLKSDFEARLRAMLG